MSNSEGDAIDDLRARKTTSGSPRRAALAVAGAVPLFFALLLAAMAPPARAAAFDVSPFGCAVQPDPRIGFAVYGYRNPNSGSVEVDLGSDNLVLEPPFIRPSQPALFAPGLHRAVWLTWFDPGDPRRNAATWFLQGAIAPVTATEWCAGLAPPDADGAPRVLRDGAAVDPSVALAPGDVLTLDPGAWGGDGMLVAAMERCADDRCVPERTDTGRSAWTDIASQAWTYVVRDADAGRTLRARVARVTSEGWASALSERSGVVAGEPAPPEDAWPMPIGGPPIPYTSPSVSGRAAEGDTLTAGPGSWTGDPAPALSGHWQRCDGGACAPIAGATGVEYVPAGADVGHRVRYVAVATAGGLPTSMAGAPVVAGAASEPTPSVVAGSPREDPPEEKGPDGDPPADNPPPGDPPPVVPPNVDRPRPDPEPAADRTAPVIRSLRLTHRRFRVAARPERRGGRRRSSIPRGTKLRLSLGERAFVRVDVQRLRRRGPRTVATITRVRPTGRSRIALSGRFGRAKGGPLAPGRYRLRVSGRDLAGNRSPIKTVRMRVVR